MVEFNGDDDFREWLMGQPRKVSIALAARAALRVLPTIAEALDREADQKRQTIVLPTFRAASASWLSAATTGGAFSSGFSTGFDTRSTLVADAATRAYAAFVDYSDVYPAAGAAVEASDAAASYANPQYSARVSARAARFSASAATDSYRWISDDATTYLSGTAAENLSLTPLWSDALPIPPEVAKAWRELKIHLIEAKEGWEVWTSWYKDRLTGAPVNEALELARVSNPDEIWDQGPAILNAEIARLIAEHAAKRPSGEAIGIVSVDGRAGRIPVAPQRPDRLAHARRRVRERREDVLRRCQGKNWFFAIEPVLEDLARTESRLPEDAIGCHDDYRDAVRDIQRRDQKGLFDRSDPDIANLMDACAESVFDIRGASPEVTEVVEERAKWQARAPDAKLLAASQRLLEETGEALDPAFAAEMQRDHNRLEAISEAVGPITDEADKALLYRFKTRLAQLWMLGQTAPEAVVVAVSGGPATYQVIAKAVELINSAKAWIDILGRLL